MAIVLRTSAWDSRHERIWHACRCFSVHVGGAQHAVHVQLTKFHHGSAAGNLHRRRQWTWWPYRRADLQSLWRRSCLQISSLVHWSGLADLHCLADSPVEDGKAKTSITFIQALIIRDAFGLP